MPPLDTQDPASQTQPPSAPDRRTLEWQIGAVLFGRVLVAALDSLRAFLLARLLDKSGFGVLSAGLTWYGLVTGLGTLALPDALMALLPRCDGGGRQLVGRSVKILAGTGALGGAIALLASLQATGDTATAMRWAALVAAIDVPGQVLQAVLLGSQRHQTAARTGLVLSGAASVALLVPAAFGASPPWLMASFGAVALVRLLLLVRAAGQLKADTPPAILAKLWPTAWPLWLTTAAGVANRSLSAAAGTALLPAAAFADLAIGSQELPVVTMLPNAVAVAVLPHLVRLHGDGRADGVQAALGLWHAGIRRLALLMLPLWVVCTLEAEPALQLLYGGPAWRSAALPFRITALLLPLRVTTYGTMLLALGLPRQVLWSQIVGVSANALLLAAAFAVPAAQVDVRMGLLAAAGAVGQAAAIAWMLAALGRATAAGVRGVFPWRDLAARVAVAVMAAAPMVALRLGIGEAWGGGTALGGETGGTALGVVGRVLAYAVAYLLALRALGWVPAEDWATLGRWLRLEPLRGAK